jgi:mRNA interferase RelE/StbE
MSDVGYSLVLSKKALKQLSKMDKQAQRMLLGWMEEHLDGCINPRAMGKALTGGSPAEWRYRVSDYRILVDIFDDEVRIEVIKIGHRRDVYRG